MAEEKGEEAKPRDIEHYAGSTRFELELEFVQALSNPAYIQYLSVNHYFDTEEFVNYCKYLQYFAKPEYTRYLLYPGPTLKVLELLQQEQFRKDIVRPDVMNQLATQWMEYAVSPGKVT